MKKKEKQKIDYIGYLYIDTLLSIIFALSMLIVKGANWFDTMTPLPAKIDIILYLIIMIIVSFTFSIIIEKIKRY